MIEELKNIVEEKDEKKMLSFLKEHGIKVCIEDKGFEGKNYRFSTDTHLAGVSIDLFGSWEVFWVERGTLKAFSATDKNLTKAARGAVEGIAYKFSK